MEEGKDTRIELRDTLQKIFAKGSKKLKDKVKSEALFNAADVEMQCFLRPNERLYQGC